MARSVPFGLVSIRFVWFRVSHNQFFIWVFSMLSHKQHACGTTHPVSRTRPVPYPVWRFVTPRMGGSVRRWFQQNGWMDGWMDGWMGFHSFVRPIGTATTTDDASERDKSTSGTRCPDKCVRPSVRPSVRPGGTGSAVSRCPGVTTEFPTEPNRWISDSAMREASPRLDDDDDDTGGMRMGKTWTRTRGG